MALLGDLQTRVDAIVQDTDGRIPDTQRDLFISDALRELSKEYPNEKIAELQGTGARQYDLSSLISDWTLDFSQVLIVALLSDSSEVRYEPGDWRLLRSPSSEVLEFLKGAPGANDTFRIRYTTLWTVDELPSFLEMPCCLLASSFYCRALASFFGQTSDPTIAADVVNYRDRSERFARRASELKEEYRRLIEPLQATRGLGIGEWDITPSWRRSFLIHGGRER
ncbi:TPA: hypothetical protein EYP37_07985 [Candidatus Poribacteria bacterium]|nr:hypothetical protein [Candidatus Poribacteria bacterium]